MKTIILGFLSVFTYLDVKYKKIPAALLALFAVCGVIFVILTKDCTNPLRYLGLFAGMVFCGVSFLCRQAVGMGDALLFTVLGWYLGIYNALLLLFLAFCGTAVYSAVLLVSGKAALKTSFPFLPFLYIAYGGMCFL